MLSTPASRGETRRPSEEERRLAEVWQLEQTHHHTAKAEAEPAVVGAEVGSELAADIAAGLAGIDFDD